MFALEQLLRLLLDLWFLVCKLGGIFERDLFGDRCPVSHQSGRLVLNRFAVAVHVWTQRALLLSFLTLSLTLAAVLFQLAAALFFRLLRELIHLSEMA